MPARGPQGRHPAEYGLSDEQGNEIIMAARAHWFTDEDEPVAEAGEAEGEDA